MVAGAWFAEPDPDPTLKLAQALALDLYSPGTLAKTLIYAFTRHGPVPACCASTEQGQGGAGSGGVREEGVPLGKQHAASDVVLNQTPDGRSVGGHNVLLIRLYDVVAFRSAQVILRRVQRSVRCKPSQCQCKEPVSV